MDNTAIADRLEAFAALLELADANPYTARAYHRAAETIRAAPVPVEQLVRDRRGGGPPGIGAADPGGGGGGPRRAARTRPAGARPARDRLGDRGAAARARRDGRHRRAGRARARAR